MTTFPRASQPQQSGQSKRKWGCFGNVSLLLIGIVALFLLLSPWAVHIGDRWTPALMWHGTGTLHSTNGAKYPLYLEIWLDPEGTGYRRKNLQGRSILCTPDKQRYQVTVYGYLRHAWLDTNGKKMQLLMFSPKNSKPKIRIDLTGTWRGQELFLDDKGNMALSFGPDGNVKGYLIGTNSPKEQTTGTLHFAPQSEFDAACPSGSATF